jgi:hypothetical protein
MHSVIRFHKILKKAETASATTENSGGIEEAEIA